MRSISPHTAKGRTAAATAPLLLGLLAAEPAEDSRSTAMLLGASMPEAEAAEARDPVESWRCRPEEGSVVPGGGALVDAASTMPPPTGWSTPVCVCA